LAEFAGVDGAGVGGLVDAVADTHEAIPGGGHRFDVALGVRLVADFLQHLGDGAVSAVFEMLEEIGDESNIESHIEAMLARGERVMGIGHRVYKTTDPRAIILEELGEQLAETSPDRKYFDLSRKVRDYLAERLSGRPLYPNVDFFSASVYRMLGIPHDLYTPIFAVARIAGWSAHLLEQYADNRLVRPNAVYAGEKFRAYEPIEARGQGESSTPR